MPMLAVNISDKLFLDIKELVEKGKYQSPEAFLEIGAFNQLALERGATPAEIIAKGHRKPRKEESEPGASSELEEHHEETGEGARAVARRPVQTVTKAAEPTVTETEVATAFKHLALIPRKDGPKPCDAKPHPDTDERIFGQVNRLFPLKLACRWLSTAATSDKKWPAFETISDRLAEDASTLGTILEKADSESDRKRDDQLSTGLPRRGNSASRDRFLSQFLARISRSGGVFPGAIWQYELAKFDDAVLCLTEQGQKFADLKNPILDAKDLKALAAFDSAECEFLIHQIKTFVPVEREDMRIILKAVAEGKVTPVDLSAAVLPLFPKSWSPVMTRTHISGLIARLGDLRLLKRNWQGRNVNYELGEKNSVETFMKD